MQAIDRIAYSSRLVGANPAEKIAFSLSQLSLAVTLPPWPGAFFVLMSVLAVTWGVARISPLTYLKVALPGLLFLLASIAPLLVTISTRGPGVPHIGLVPHGFALASGVGLRAAAAFHCLLFLVFTTPVPQVLEVMRKCRVPAVVTEVSLLVYRYIWVLLDTMSAVYRAQDARLGWSSLRHSYRSAAMLAGCLLGQAIHRGRALERALEARNWQGHFRLLDNKHPLSWRNLSVIVVVDLAILAGTLVWTAE